MDDNKGQALAVAVKALYFDDDSDYESALWEIVEILGGQVASHMLEIAGDKAYELYCLEKDQ